MSAAGRLDLRVSASNDAADDLRDLDHAFVAWSFRSTFPWPLRVVLFGFLLATIAAALTGCSATVETDNTPWGKARVATEAKPPPPIYSRSSRSTVTKPPPPAPEVEETTCEGNVCGVPGR